MLDPANDLLPPLASPSISSVSSSDIDTESTGSFFHDRSTTLGTLMGVSFAAITFRAPPQHRNMHMTASSPVSAAATGAGTRSRENKKKRVSSNAPAVVPATRRRWWWLCGEDDAKPASLGEFLEVERRFGDAAFYDAAAAELEGVMVTQQEQRQQQQEETRNGRLLFADGRVLPPADDPDETSSTVEVLCRFLVSITGICR